MNRDEVQDLLALGAAGALTEEEYRMLDELLGDDPDLAAEYRDLQATAAALADATSEPPPAGLRAVVLEAIRSLDQLPREDADGPVADPFAVAPSAGDRLVTVPSATATVPFDADDDRSDATVVPIHRRRWMIPATVAAAVVMLLVAGLLVNQFADAPADDQVAAVLNDDEATTIPMDPLVDGFDGFDIVYSSAEGAAVLTGDGLPVPSGDSVYELWAIRGANAPERVEIFRPDEGGDVELLLVGIDPASATWAITEEPAGGSDTPTEPILAITE